MARVNFTGSSGTIPNLNQNFTELYDLRELINTTGYGAAAPKVYVDAATGFFGFGAASVPAAPVHVKHASGVVVEAAGAVNRGVWRVAGGTSELLQLGPVLGALTRVQVGCGAIVGGTGYWESRDDGSHVWYGAGAAQRMTLAVNGDLLLNTGALGYGAGSGGAVTQATSKATGVTLNKSNGQITLNAASLAASTTVLFTVTDSLVAATDCVHINRGSGGTAGAYQVWVDSVAAGSFVVAVRNTTGGALAEAVTISFAIIKAVTA